MDVRQRLGANEVYHSITSVGDAGRRVAGGRSALKQHVFGRLNRAGGLKDYNGCRGWHGRHRHCSRSCAKNSFTHR